MQPLQMAALILAAALGNALAIGVHCLAWWLRKRAPSLTTLLSFLAALGLVGAFCAAEWLLSEGSWDGPLTAQAQAEAYRQAAIGFAEVMLIFFVSSGIIGALQARQIPTHWFEAAFCWCFELVFAISVLVVNYFVSPASFLIYDAVLWACGAFWLMLLVLALFRPMFLRAASQVRAMFRFET